MSVSLERLLEATRDRLERARRERPFEELERLAVAAEPRPFREALSRPGTSLVAEYKRRSPSAGAIREGADVGEVVGAYERGGAVAISVLTDEPHFGGSLADLEKARAAVELPILRKDFTVDRYQLYEAKTAGADAVLLVARTLGPAEIDALHAEALALDLDVVVEVHSGAELEVALDLDVDVIGVNNRDLDDFSVDLGRTFELLPDVPAGKTVVSESGIVSRADVEELEAIGVDAVLVGEALMRASDPEAAARELAAGEQLDS
ncbi:MAG: indole-3-glycerol phosphate synthase TrpC [Thermoleophilaceae bacterium]|nr:indole-3-glycerol phosphate synthase TrpC [Thermoleophilaceae bacterium]